MQGLYDFQKPLWPQYADVCHTLHPKRSLRGLLTLPSGVYFAALHETRGIKLCVSLDTSRTLIYDPAEEYPLRLCPEAVQACMESAFSFLGVSGIREMKLSPNDGNSKQPCHRNRNNTSKRCKASKHRDANLLPSSPAERLSRGH